MFKNFSKLSFTQQMTIPMTLVGVIVLGSIGFISTRDAFKETKDKAITSSLQESEKSALQIEMAINKPFAQVETQGRNLLTQIEHGMQSRERTHWELLEILKSDESYLASWSAWEPNAFDGKDSLYANKEYHEGSGRYYPWWIRQGKEITYKTLLNPETPDLGDWYFKPMQSAKSMLLEPYSDTIDGKKVIMTSAVHTITKNGKALGIVGVDIRLDQVQKLVSELKPYAESKAYLLTDTQLVVAAPNVDETMKPFNADEKILAAAKENKISSIEIKTAEGEKQFIILPLKIYNLDQRWTLVVETPMSMILAAAYSIMWRQIIISLIGQALMMLTVYMIAKTSSKKINSISSELESSSTHVSASIEILNEMGTELSTSSNEAASAVESTTSSLEEVTSMVKLNTDNAKQAATHSSQAADLALRGEKTLQELIVRMQSIEKSSKQIEEIITIIDDIAFQTNLLALNASVEAARAGEHGKGFAVVAEAVRTLAQRSAEAAKDISQLITTSVQEVNIGTTVAKNSGQLLGEISASIQKVSTLNSEIAHASDEQSAGVMQISNSMSEIDKLVQKNAEQAELIARTAEEIKDQSQVLKDTATTLSGSQEAA